MDRRKFNTLALSVPLSATLLSGCTRANASRGHLSIATGPDRFNVDDARFSFTLRNPHAQIGETAVAPDASYNPVPNLFSTWEVKEGKYVIDIRPGLQHHDGSAFDAECAISSLNIALVRRVNFLEIEPTKIKKLGTHRVSFESTIGSNLVMHNMSNRSITFFSNHTDRRIRPTGTGPWMFHSYSRGNYLRVKRNPGYWGKLPYQSEIEFKFVPDEMSRVMALQAGEVDLVADVNSTMLNMLAPGMALHKSRPFSCLTVLVNHNGSNNFDLLADAKLRKALTYCINRESSARIMFAGNAVQADGLQPSWMFDLGVSVKLNNYNLQRAAELLDEAGWLRNESGVRFKNGRKLSLRLVSGLPNAEALHPFPDILKQSLAKVGIDLQVVSISDGLIFESQYLEPGNADLFLTITGNTTLDPTFLLYLLFHSQTPWRGYRHMAAGRAFDAAIDAARRAEHAAERLEQVRSAHRMVIDERMAAIPVLHVPQFVLARPGLQVPMFEHRDWIDYGAVRELPQRPL